MNRNCHLILKLQNHCTPKLQNISKQLNIPGFLEMIENNHKLGTTKPQKNHWSKQTPFHLAMGQKENPCFGLFFLLPMSFLGTRQFWPTAISSLTRCLSFNHLLLQRRRGLFRFNDLLLHPRRLRLLPLCLSFPALLEPSFPFLLGEEKWRHKIHLSESHTTFF